MSGQPAERRPTLEDVAPLLLRLQRAPSEGVTLSCLTLRLLWSPPGDLDALDALLPALDAAPASDPDVPLLRALALAARRGLTGATARSLTSYAGALEQAGEEDCALLVAGVALRWGADALPPRSQIQIHLLQTRLYRKAARWSEAATAWARVEELARLADDPWIRIRAQLGRVMLLRHRGNLPEAQRVAEGVLAAATAGGFRDLQALAANDLGTVLETRGCHVDAAIRYWEAARLAGGHQPGLMFRALGNLGGMLRSVGCMEGAGAALRVVERDSPDWGDRTNASIELLDVCSATGDMLGVRRMKAQLVDRAARMPPSMATDYRYRLGLVLWRAGEVEQAREAWRTALRIAEANELGYWIIRLEAELDRGPATPPGSGDERARAVELDVQAILAGSPAGSLTLGAGLVVGPGPSRIGAGGGPDCEQDQEQGK